MSVISDKVTIEDVQHELNGLEATYTVDRKAAMAAVTKPYQVKRRKLLNLLKVLEAEKGGDGT